MPKYLLFFFLLCSAFTLKAQTWEIGASAGAAGYMGDLNANNPVKVSGISYGGFIQRNFDGYLSAKINFTHGTIDGDDALSNDAQFRARNLKFTTYLNEIAAIGEFNFFKYIPEAGKNKFTPFVFLGVGSLNYTPTTIYQGVAYDLRSYETEGEKKPYPNNAFSVIYGVGAKYNIMGKFTLSANIGYRNPNTDYLDDVSGYYPPPVGGISQALSDRSGENTGNYIGTPGTQRGDLRSHDTYFFTQISLSYTFVTQRCYFER